MDSSERCTFTFLLLHAGPVVVDGVGWATVWIASEWLYCRCLRVACVCGVCVCVSEVSLEDSCVWAGWVRGGMMSTLDCCVVTTK